MWPEIPGDPQKNKPDLVVIEGSQRKITVVDVTIPFEGEADCLQEARQAKEAKYSSLKTFLEGKYEEVSLDALSFGVMGPS